MLILLSSFIVGLFVGILLSLIAIVVGKKYNQQINEPYISSGKAQIIKRKDLIDEILNGN